MSTELKHTFSAGRMNKDLDERLVPNGEYRDATNVEIATSESSNAGVVQTILGNTKRETMATFDNYTLGSTLTSYYDLVSSGSLHTNSATCVGAIEDKTKDVVYFFVQSSINTVTGVALNTWKDYILEYNTVTERLRYVFVDIFYVSSTVTSTVSSSNTFHVELGAGVATNQTGIRIGMTVTSGDINSTNDVLVTDISYDTTGGVNKWKITVDTPINLTATNAIQFTGERVLEFEKGELIPAINILDDFIFWTDNKHEPKKINVTRSILGTGGTEPLHNAGNGGYTAATNAIKSTFQGENPYFHTRLVVAGQQINSYEIVTNPDTNRPIYVGLPDVTVIKRAPVTALELDMYRTSTDRVNTITGVQNPVSGTTSANFTTLMESGWNEAANELIVQPGTEVTVTFNQPVDFRMNDVLLFASMDNNLVDLDEDFDVGIRDVRAKVVYSPGDDLNPNVIHAGPFIVEVLSIKEDVTIANQEWIVRLEDKDPLFNLKFPRFSYRYKYEDGEYSTFAPWSEMAFLPGHFDYQPKKGHNLGMVNGLRGLKLKGYYPQYKSRPSDVVEIDILYKETNNPTVYVVETIRPTDPHPLWPNNATSEFPNERGEFELTTDMIHAVVPSNQLIRPWDNVPKKALAQEVTANRIVYGNYVHNFDVKNPPKIELSLNADEYTLDYNGYPAPSVKSLRDYHVGVVFSDRYGRETPVLTNEAATIRVNKLNTATRNRLKVSLSNSIEPPSWAEYYSFYVKETSVPYHTLSQDRWYNASDGNVWLSFPSSERNKIDEEDFLILKKAHGSNHVVQDKAKYKILAIESEAPDFIKTRRLSIGRTIQGDAIGESGIGYPLPNFRRVFVEREEFISTFGDQLHRERPKNLYLRIWQGSENKSNFYLVTNINYTGDEDEGANTDPFAITVEELFGDDIGFTSTDGTYEGASGVSGIQIELVEFRVMNLPEFDGRFFVKVFKDDVLQKYVVESSPSEWFVDMAMPVSYINNNGYINAGTRMGTAQTGAFGYAGVVPERPIYANLNDGTNSTYDLNQDGFMDNWWTNYPYNGLEFWTTWNYYRNEAHPTEHSWSTLNGYVGDGTHIQGAPYVWLNGDDTYAGITNMASLMEICNIRSINGNGYTNGPYQEDTYHAAAVRYWKYINSKPRIFIDACTAYSYGGWQYSRPGTRFNSTVINPGQINPDGSINNAGSPDQNSDNGFWDFMAGAPNTGDIYGVGGDNYPSDAQGQITPGDVGPHNVHNRGALALYGVPGGSSVDPDSEGGITNIPAPTVSGTGGAFGDYYAAGGQGGAAENGYSDLNPAFHGTPSRGIWDVNNFSAIDLSWCGWDDTEGDDGVPNTEETVSVNISQHPEDTYNNMVKEFMEKLVEPGTRFRFQNDPDKQVYTVFPYVYPYVFDGFDNPSYYDQPTSIQDGVYGIFNVGSDPSSDTGHMEQWANWNRRQRWTILVEPKIGDTARGYNPIHGTHPTALVNVNENGFLLGVDDPDFRRALKHDGTDQDIIEIVHPFSDQSSHYSDNPGIWETEPKESVELDIYYQASSLIPLVLNDKTNEEFIPLGSELVQANSYFVPGEPTNILDAAQLVQVVYNNKLQVLSWDKTTITLNGNLYWPEIVNAFYSSLQPNYDANNPVLSAGEVIHFNTPNNNSVTAVVAEDVYLSNATTNISLGGVNIDIKITGDISTENVDHMLYTQEHKLGWNNCWCFGNGVESDRIRDDFNAPEVDNGVKVSASVDNPDVKEERRKYGMIWSGIYNSQAGVNNTNQFIAGENITKDINPSHGSIQALKARDTRVIMFCEDKVLRADTNRDMLFNADGSSQVVASTAVIGSAVAYQGDYGISTNPESLAVTPRNMFFTDVMRGKVLALNDNEGIRDISEAGMKDYFSDLMARNVHSAIGTYDERKNEYNVSIGTKYKHEQHTYTAQTTVSYNERSKGWSSFKTFSSTVSVSGALTEVKGLETGVSLNNEYYTFFDGHIWQHHHNATRNNFYATQNTSDITLLFNDQPEFIKSFNTLNYEGSQARITNFDTETFDGYYNNDVTTNDGIQAGITTITDGEYFNLGGSGADSVGTAGWSVENLTTNLQSCGSLEFKDKEGKWFAYPTGETTTLNNLNGKEFSVQGLGQATMTHAGGAAYKGNITITVKNDSANAAGDVNWD